MNVLTFPVNHQHSYTQAHAVTCPVPGCDDPVSEQDKARNFLERRAAIVAKAPAGACAVIVAELEQDACEIQTDYFAATSVREVAIGFRMSKRESFVALRKAAALFPDTAHMGPGKGRFVVRVLVDVDKDIWPAAGSPIFAGHFSPYHSELHGAIFETREEAQLYCDALEGMLYPVTVTTKDDEDAEIRSVFSIAEERIEHRENYSMGGGNYLKAGSRYDSGWNVHSVEIKHFSGSWGEVEDAIG